MEDDKKTPGSYVFKVAEEARQYLSDLLKENERLRLRVLNRERELEICSGACERSLAVENENRNLREMVNMLEEQVLALRKQNLEYLSNMTQSQARLARIEQQIDSVEAENKKFFDQYYSIEKQNTNLMNLYVSSYRLHSSIIRSEVIEAIREIIINLIGSEEFALYEIDELGQNLVLTDSCGIDAEKHKIETIDSVIGQLASQLKTYSEENVNIERIHVHGRRLRALVPLILEKKLSGAIAIFSLLPQKFDIIDELDLELFNLFATHASVALYSSRSTH